MSSAEDSRDGFAKKKKRKTGKVFPLNTLKKTSNGIKQFFTNKDGDDEEVLMGKNEAFEFPASVISDYSVDRFKDLNCTKRQSANVSTDQGIDPNIKSSPDKPNIANAELIGYFGHLSVSADPNIQIDLDYLELILKRGADINSGDQYGQTVLHEVARTWDPDVAVFLIERGGNVNRADQFGRTPLHVAAAVDFPEMITILLEHGANIEALTLGEEKTPLHYAACNDACQSLRLLIKKGAAVHPRDYKGRTPLQAAAELDRSETAALLLELGGKASDRDYSGHTALLLMVTKMPAVAMNGLNQLYRCDRQNRKQHYDLHFLEPPPDKDNIELETRTVLQSIVDFNQLDVIMHPVIRRLVEVKWNQFGRMGAYKQLAFNLLFILMWTVLALSLESPFDLEFPQDIWRLALEACGSLLTIIQIIMELKDYFDSKAAFMKWKRWKMHDIETDFQYCHPRWPQERHYLEQQINEIKGKSPSYFSEAWNWFDWFVYISLVCITALHITDIFIQNDDLSQATQNLFAIVIIFIWIRLMKSVRAFQQLGPFIVMLGLVLKDFAIFIFLYANFYIPYACAFWMIYSKNNGTIPSMSSPDTMMYSLFRITLVDEYEYENMRDKNTIMTYILLVSFLLISAILCINVLIAQLSNTFQRVYDNATAIALMQQTKITLGIEEGLFKRKRRKYWRHIREQCSPLSLFYDDDVVSEQGDDLRKMTFHIQDALSELDDFVREQHSQGHRDELATLNRKMDALEASNKRVTEKMNTDMKIMQALLMSVLDEMGIGSKAGGGQGDDSGSGRRSRRGDNDDDDDQGTRGGHSGQRSQKDDDDDDDNSDRDRRGSRGRSRSSRRDRRDDDNYDDHGRGRHGQSGRGTSQGRRGRDDRGSDGRGRNDEDNDRRQGQSQSRQHRRDNDYDNIGKRREGDQSQSSRNDRGQENYNSRRNGSEDKSRRETDGRKGLNDYDDLRAWKETQNLSRSSPYKTEVEEDREFSPRFYRRRSTLMSESLFSPPPLSENARSELEDGVPDAIPKFYRRRSTLMTGSLFHPQDSENQARMQMIELNSKKERKLRKQREEYLQKKLWKAEDERNGQRSPRADKYLDEEEKRKGDLAELIKMRGTPKL